jgi:5'-nucleotidase
VSALVDALNADAETARWAFVDSPTAVDPGEDVIRTAMIYNPETVDLVGDSALFYDAAFSDAREPFAQTFKAEGADDADGFAVIANHFKSKGSGTPDPDGQGNANDRRKLQATALVGFADSFAAGNGVEKVFLTGDFNAYSEEDPIQILHEAGYTSLESTSDAHEESYNFDGMIGSLDHVLANDAAKPDVTGVDIWTINAYESQYYEYSRFNYNVRELYAPNPFRASDHNPELVGIDDTRAEAMLAVSHTPSKVKAGKTEAKLRVLVTAPELVPTGTVRVTVAGQEPLVAQLNEEGLATVRLPVFDTAGVHTLEIEYDGDGSVQGAATDYTVQVVG